MFKEVMIFRKRVDFATHGPSEGHFASRMLTNSEIISFDAIRRNCV